MREKVLVLDSDRDHQKRIRFLLHKAGYETMTVGDRFSGLQALREGGRASRLRQVGSAESATLNRGGFSAVLVREEADGTISVPDTLQDIKAISPEMPVVVSADSWTPQSLQYCTEVGAFFCMDKEAEDDLLVQVLGKAIEEYKLSSKL
jgi:DNA-binding NtrC family response regulator